MPLYAGFDIGIKNLAFCVIDSEQWRKFQRDDEELDPGIVCWQNLNLIGEAETCNQLLKSGKQRGEECGKTARWSADEKFYCGKHKPEHPTIKKYKPPATKTINMTTIKKAAFRALDNLPIFDQVQCVALETQPRINQKMKMFCAAIETYFIIRHQLDKEQPALKTIKASPSKNKLKLYQGPAISTGKIKNPYDKRKYLAQCHTEYFLSKCPDILEQHFWCNKKRDDLADAFLHCLAAFC